MRRWSLAGSLACPLGQAVGAALAILLTSAKMDKIPSFRPLSCFALGVLYLNMPLFRVLRGFLEGFPRWMWVCVVRVLCVACGAFVCVWS